MANTNFPRGLQPHEKVLHKNTYNIPSGYAQDLFIGDPVIATGTGGEINIIFDKFIWGLL